MDLKNLISKNDDEDASKRDVSPGTAAQTPIPALEQPQQTPPLRSNSQPRLSIHNLMNNDGPELGNSRAAMSTEIRKQNSITNLTHDEDVGVDGKKTPSISRRVSSANSSEQGSPTTKFAEPKAKKKAVSSSLHDQIKELEELKNKQEVAGAGAGAGAGAEPGSPSEQSNGKPKRYTEKPVWAKDYIPTARKHTKARGGVAASIATPTKFSIPSITGSIPRNDFNKVVTEWIWANVEGLKQDYADVANVEQYVELELKVGNIWDKVKDRRLQLPINTEAVLSVDFFHNECYFKSGIPLQQFHDIKSYLSKLAQDKVTAKNSKFVVENSHLIDLIASEKKRNDRPITGRISLDVKTKRKMASIQKQRVADLMIYMPNTLFDLRLSLSLELPYELNDSAYENFKRKVSLEREKERVSYTHLSTFTKIDLTKVKENRVAKYELELELNTTELLKSMNYVMDDPLYYIDLIQSFLDNGRIITRQLSVQY